MAKDSIHVTIGAKDGASAVLAGISARAVAFGVVMGNLASRLASSAMNGLRRWIDEALEAERANVLLDASLRGMGTFTPELARRYRDLANAIQNETGASDEAAKSVIAQLTSLGVASAQMDVAARSVFALKAIGKDGAEAVRAVARAMEGNIDAFARLAPEVKLATTLEEKYTAANRLLAAAYTQQQANLKTVGGAWAALKGRIGDAREELIGAVFEGLRLGATFNSAQKALGRFLQSDAFKRITDRLRDAADYARRIGEAMSTEGGGKAVAQGFANIVLAAIKDGADYLAGTVKRALIGDPSKITPLKEFRVDLAKMFGTPEEEARRVVYGGTDRLGWKSKSDSGGGHLDKALAEFDALVARRSDVVRESAKVEEEVAEIQASQMAPVLEIAAERQRLAEIEKEKAVRAANVLKWERYAETFGEMEARAKERSARSGKLLADLQDKTLAEFIKGAQAAREAEKARADDDRGARRKIGNIFSRLGGNKNAALTIENIDAALRQSRKRGKLSKEDEQMLLDARQKMALEKAAREDQLKAAREARQLREKREAADKEADRMRQKMAQHLESIDQKIDGIAEVN